ncbi:MULTISPECIES: DUF3040 domain-containing protein [Actinoplanes]|uniref:DUF3040 domain-containing protein n=1 Tax=Actinoplanes TaxID=1865 RepID=UPI0005F28DFD|nr:MULTISPECIES: DUF3040 domain-containing protein [Actinoplanes]GLY06772.1 hypothetical protein Acsp01_71510 [Actinoplanes sp. NBRC 101535]
MLDDRDRRILDDLEQQLAVADPEFAARMSAPAAEQPFPAVAGLCALLFICAPLVMLLFGWPGVIIAVDVFAAAVAVVLIHRRRKRR